jgi:hypothetical protein
MPDKRRGRNAEVMDLARQLDALMDDLRISVGNLAAVLTREEEPPETPGAERLVTDGPR